MVGAEGAEVVEVGRGGGRDDGQAGELGVLDAPDASGGAAAVDEDGDLFFALAGEREAEAVVETDTLATASVCRLMVARERGHILR